MFFVIFMIFFCRSSNNAANIFLNNLNKPNFLPGSIEMQKQHIFCRLGIILTEQQPTYSR